MKKYKGYLLEMKRVAMNLNSLFSRKWLNCLDKGSILLCVGAEMNL